MAKLTELPVLRHNRGLIADPASFARDAHAASWLYLCGESFAATDGGMSYADVQSAVDRSVNIVSDPLSTSFPGRPWSRAAPALGHRR